VYLFKNTMEFIDVESHSINWAWVVTTVWGYGDWG
jgi:hypothetical protein